MSHPTAVIVVGSDLAIRFANEAAAAIAGTDAAELMGSPLFVRFPPDEPDAALELARALPGGEPHYFSTTTAPSDGTASRVLFRFHVAAEDTSRQPYATAILVQIATEQVRCDASRSPSRDDERFRATYAHTSLSFVDARELFEAFDRVMRTEQLFLDKDLDLEAVCQRLQTNQLYLSQVVNFFARESFRDYVNRCRISYLERAVSDPDALGIGDLWRAAGFGSYSAFRRFLQASRDMTPGEFARTLRSPVRLEVGG